MSENRGLNIPGQQQRTRGVPESFNIVSFEQFTGLNTKSPRIAIQPTECSWLDGFMPVTDNFLRAVYGAGSPIYTSSQTILYLNSFNIRDAYYLFMILSDGSCGALNLASNSFTQIAPPGTITSPSSIAGSASWGGQFFLFSVAQTNGYFIWDGTNLFRSGTIGPIVQLTNDGIGYTSPPTVTLYGGSGTSAAFSATVSNGAVTQVNVTNPGSGYALGDTPILVFTGGNGTTTSYGTADVSNGVITNVTLTNGGGGYQNSSGVQITPSITVTDSTGSGAVLSVSEMAGGQVIALRVTAGGSGYTNPTITFSASSGSGAEATAIIESGVITGMGIVNAGIGYDNVTSIEFFSSSGTGAAATATLTSTGSVNTVAISQGGSGYTAPVYWVAQGDGPASGTVELMPFGVSGTAIETFQSRVWLSNGQASSNQNRVIFSAAGDPADFSPADGGGAFMATDSFTRVGYHGLKQTNGFLYLIGDSSENTISGVQSTTPSGSATTTQVITTFNNQNSDPQLGSPWPSSIQVFSRNLVFANPLGIMVSVGGAVTKISDALDGFYTSAISLSPTANYSSAVATVFGTPCYCLLVPIVNPITSVTVNTIIMWNGRKFWTFPAPTFTYICSQEENSILSAYGTDGNSIYKLFSTPEDYTKTIQTKLWVDPSYWETKTAIRLSGIIYAYNADQAIDITIDSESGSTSPIAVPTATTTPWIFGPLPVGQAGRCNGLTLTTTSKDIGIIALGLGTQIYTPNV